ncbi:MAG: MarR family winged helix-turn-helix transcriptional regulator [Gammaproteobacteria bacterium]
MATRITRIETAEPEEVGLERLLCHRVTVLSKVMNRLAGRFLSAEFGLTIAEWWILGQLDQHSPRTLRWISEATLTDKAQLSRAAASLVERGYITRRTDPSDARSILFSITEEGREISTTSGVARRDVDRELLGLLSEDDREALCRSLDRITEFLLSEDESIEYGAASRASAD